MIAMMALTSRGYVSSRGGKIFSAFMTGNIVFLGFATFEVEVLRNQRASVLGVGYGDQLFRYLSKNSRVRCQASFAAASS